MNLRLIKVWDDIRYSYWFVPGLMAVASMVLATLTITLDGQVQSEWYRNVPFVWSGGADGARELLSMVAGSMITVAGVVFSITIVAFSLASTQFGPRLLRNFMRDTGNQLVLGSFLATFLFCLMILRTIRSEEEIYFVPNVSVTLGIAMALISLGVLIYFIHHVSLSIQAPVVISEVAEDLFDKINYMFPGSVGEDPPNRIEPEEEKDWRDQMSRNSWMVNASRSGYLQAVDERRLLRIATQYDLVIRLLHRPGHFIIQGDEIAQVHPNRGDQDRLTKEIRKVLLVGRQRTSAQDVEFSINQLVEMAVRALSPAINDPFTAIACIDWLGAALSRLAVLPLPSPYRCDSAGHLRVIVDRPETFSGLVEAAFNQIRQAAEGNAAVEIHLLEVIQVVLERTQDESFQSALLNQAMMVKHSSQDTIRELKDRQDVLERFQKVVDTEKSH